MRRVIFLFLFYQVNTAIGIHLRNFTESKIGQAGLGNTYTNIVPESDLKDLQIGVWLENCKSIGVEDNFVAWTGFTSDLQDYLPSLRGFSINNVTASAFVQNKVKNMAAGFNVFEDCSNTKLLCNTMDACYHGLYFDPTGINNQLTDQGDLATQTAWKNRWPNNIDPLNHIGGSNIQTGFSWLYKTGSATEFIPITQLSNITPQTVANETSTCNPPMLLNDQKRESAFGDAVNDSTNNDPDSTDFKYNNKETFYKAAKENPALLALGTANDAKYQQEFTELAQSNIGKYEEVREHFENDEKQQALLKLSLIVDENLKEQNLKTVNGIIAVNYDYKLDADSDTISILLPITYMHPFYGGDAVYMARALLHLDVIDQVPALRRGRPDSTTNSDTDANTVKGMLYPNPATNTVRFTYPVSETKKIFISLFDAYGKRLQEYELKKNAIDISTISYVQGVYFIHVIVDGYETENHKLILIK